MSERFDAGETTKGVLCSCNRHADCDAADVIAREHGYSWADHCRDECCEECFGY